MNLNKAAVIVLHEKKSDSIILTERTINLRHHPGEICFPGGSWQIDDKNLYETALRELQEELGVEPNRVRLKKQLQIEQTPSGFLIQPWRASIEDLSPFKINEEEVNRIIWLPMARVFERSNYKKLVIERKGIKISTHQFIDEAHFIWGVTARIMMQLC